MLDLAHQIYRFGGFGIVDMRSFHYPCDSLAPMIGGEKLELGKTV